MNCSPATRTRETTVVLPLVAAVVFAALIVAS